jgi:hypothetical protein
MAALLCALFLTPSEADATSAPVSSLGPTQIADQPGAVYTTGGFGPAPGGVSCQQYAAWMGQGGNCSNGVHVGPYSGSASNLSPSGGVCTLTPSYACPGYGLGVGTINMGYAGMQGTCPQSGTSQGANDQGTLCNCPDGLVADSTHLSCVSHACPAFGTYVPPDSGTGDSRYTWPGMQTSSNYCHHGCGEMAQAQAVDGMGVVEYGYGGGIALGSSCGANAAAGAAAPASAASAVPLSGDASKCTGATACSGTVNGTTVCVACGTPTVNSTSQTVSTPASGASSSTTTDTTVQTNPDGSTTSTTTSKGSDGSTVVTVSAGLPGAKGGGGAGAGGGPCVGTDCGSGSDSFGGSCSASFSCDGDAVQCAIAMEQHQRDCTFFQPETQNGTVGDATSRFKTALTDGLSPSWSPAAAGNVTNTSVDLSTSLDQSRVWSASCPGDRVLSGPMGLSFNFPLSQLCSPLQMAGNALVAVSFLMAAFIVFRK